jgi:hypothetical protein
VSHISNIDSLRLLSLLNEIPIFWGNSLGSKKAFMLKKKIVTTIVGAKSNSF